MDIEKAKKTCKAYINAIDTFGTIDYKCINNLYEPIDAVLSELEKKDKVINEMAEILTRYMSTIDNNKPYDLSIGKGTRKMTVEEVREYFTNKVEREGK